MNMDGALKEKKQSPHLCEVKERNKIFVNEMSNAPLNLPADGINSYDHKHLQTKVLRELKKKLTIDERKHTN